ncbi:uncharacterized protein SPSC_06629 [Sporisorium scitamineum]|uniref:Uncharacterized protein n=1 Tax=Sporisorium scitamineum TaxID=49012 RepID=A0A140KNR0_9BASI|nr:uncharacterized protein SPSC_06629 [Sporisorium scitamineum]
MHPLRASTFVLLILVLTAMLDPTMAMAGSNRASSSTGKTSAKSRLWTNIKRILYGRPVERPQATILPYIENIMQKHDWEKFKAVWDEAVKNKWLDDHIGKSILTCCIMSTTDFLLTVLVCSLHPSVDRSKIQMSREEGELKATVQTKKKMRSVSSKTHWSRISKSWHVISKRMIQRRH